MNGHDYFYMRWTTRKFLHILHTLELSEQFTSEHSGILDNKLRVTLREPFYERMGIHK